MLLARPFHLVELLLDGDGRVPVRRTRREGGRAALAAAGGVPARRAVQEAAGGPELSVSGFLMAAEKITFRASPKT